jgi:signal transduction histidine kinase
MPATPPLLLTDRAKLGRVLSNLLTNAVKFTDAGSIEVSVILKGDCAELVVRDTGRGIEADALPLIFDRFLQVAQSSGGRVGGLGLGLWLAKHIVNLHAGTITVVSDGLGQGACFVVRIPAMTSHNG